MSSRDCVHPVYAGSTIGFTTMTSDDDRERLSDWRLNATPQMFVHWYAAIADVAIEFFRLSIWLIRSIFFLTFHYTRCEPIEHSDASDQYIERESGSKWGGVWGGVWWQRKSIETKIKCKCFEVVRLIPCSELSNERIVWHSFALAPRRRLKSLERFRIRIRCEEMAYRTSNKNTEIKT